MKRLIAACVVICALLGCFGGPRAPDWLATAVSRLEQFEKEYLGGRMDVAELNFSLAVAEVKKSGDLDTLGQVYLTKMALETALLSSMNEEDFLNVNAASPSVKSENYYRFLQGRWQEVDISLLPQEYRSFAARCKEGKGQHVDALKDISQPLSRLIACAIDTMHNGEDEGVLTVAVDTASQQGWKRALIVYLERLAAYYDKRGDRLQAARVRTRLAIITP